MVKLKFERTQGEPKGEDVRMLFDSYLVKARVVLQMDRDESTCVRLLNKAYRLSNLH